MIKISVQADLLIKELEALKNMKGWLRQLLRTSKEKEVRGCTKIPVHHVSSVDLDPFILSLIYFAGCL